ncbi:MAG: hypothetical protein GY838_16295 [bacterium]|nr:hypothetical protein [bacterium]
MNRLDRIRNLLARDGHDGLLLSGLENIRYLTGYAGHAANVIVCAGEALDRVFADVMRAGVIEQTAVAWGCRCTSSRSWTRIATGSWNRRAGRG